MGLRPAKCYSDLDNDRAYTRIALTVPKKNYIGTNPAIKIRQFNMGNGIYEFSNVIDLIAKESKIVRDNAIESARILITKGLSKKIRKDGYFIKLRVYPFHVLRENKQAQGAGADRVSTGMSHSFGRPIGRSVRIRKGKIILSVLVDEKDIKTAMKCMLKANAKLPIPIELKVHTDIESIGTKPRKVKLLKEKEDEEEKKEGEESKEAEEGKKEEKKNTGKTSKAADKEAKDKADDKDKKDDKKKK